MDPEISDEIFYHNVVIQFLDELKSGKHQGIWNSTSGIAEKKLLITIELCSHFVTKEPALSLQIMETFTSILVSKYEHLNCLDGLTSPCLISNGLELVNALFHAVSTFPRAVKQQLCRVSQFSSGLLPFLLKLYKIKEYQASILILNGILKEASLFALGFAFGYSPQLPSTSICTQLLHANMVFNAEFPLSLAEQENFLSTCYQRLSEETGLNIRNCIEVRMLMAVEIMRQEQIAMSQVFFNTRLLLTRKLLGFLVNEVNRCSNACNSLLMKDFVIVRWSLIQQAQSTSFNLLAKSLILKWTDFQHEDTYSDHEKRIFIARSLFEELDMIPIMLDDLASDQTSPALLSFFLEYMQSLTHALDSKYPDAMICRNCFDYLINSLALGQSQGRVPLLMKICFKFVERNVKLPNLIISQTLEQLSSYKFI